MIVDVGIAVIFFFMTYTAYSNPSTNSMDLRGFTYGIYVKSLPIDPFF